MRRLAKILRIAGLVAVILAVILAVAGFWWVRRPWPETSGEIALPGLAAPVVVRRVPPGVPHLYARSAHDLFFAQGYVHAQDRLWQMEMNRRAGDGELSALFGAATLDADRALRAFGIRRAAERDWAVLSPAARAALVAYAGGVNAFIATHRGRLPLEFTLLRDTPRPWTPVDSLTWGKLMALNLSLNFSYEILRSQLAARLGAAAADELMGPYPADQPVIVPRGAPSPPPKAAAAGRDDPAGGPVWARDPAVQAGLARLASLGGLRRGWGSMWGSNAWVVGGAATATGKPLLANDTHLGLQMPSVWYQIGLHGGGYDDVGFSFPGMPFVVLGHNRRIAWGITNSCADVQDLYLERLDGARYLLAGAWRDLAVRHETIEVRGGKPVDFAVRETAHGPIVNDAVPELKGSPPMALRWTALAGAPLIDGLMALDQAGDWAGFRRALGFWDVPSLDFLYADVDGNIGYQMTGKVPLRAPGHTGLVPVPGWTGAAEWRGFIPFAALPSVENPASGFLVAANNKIVADGYRYFLAYDMADPYRARRITDRLAGRRGLTRRDMRDLQAETYGLPAAALRPYLLAAARPRGDLERQAVERLREWDLRYEPDAVGATIFEVWYWSFLGDVLGDELGGPLLEQYRAAGLGEVPAIVTLMGRPGDPLFDDRRTPQVERRDDIVRRSFARTVAALARRYGADTRTWRYGSLHAITFVHQPLGASGIAPLEWIFNSASVPARGTAFTVDSAVADPVHPFARYAVNFGSSQRAIYDLQSFDRSLWVNSTGESAHAFHPHREDQIVPWEAIEHYPMTGSEKAVEAAAEATLTLRPPSSH
jgi:penicillin amidase